MIKFKLFNVIILFSTLIFTSTACTKENDGAKLSIENETIQETVQVAAAGKNLPKVLDVKSVSKGTKGKAVDFTWEMDGKKYSFAEFTKGKVVLLNFWATWCGPCRMEIPDLVEIDNELPDKDFVMIGVALDNRGSLEQIRTLIQNFAKTNKMKYINFLPTQDIINPYGGVQSIPTTFIIDRKGNVVEKIIGARSKADFMKSIKKAMKS